MRNSDVSREDWTVSNSFGPRRFGLASQGQVEQPATTSHAPTSTTLMAANAGTAKASRSPTKTTPAWMTSPARTKKESTACFALYLVSRLVGSHSACLVVLPSE